MKKIIANILVVPIMVPVLLFLGLVCIGTAVAWVFDNSSMRKVFDYAMRRS